MISTVFGGGMSFSDAVLYVKLSKNDVNNLLWSGVGVALADMFTVGYKLIHRRKFNFNDEMKHKSLVFADTNLQILVGLIGFIVCYAALGENVAATPLFLNIFMTGFFDETFRFMEEAFWSKSNCFTKKEEKINESDIEDQEYSEKSNESDTEEQDYLSDISETRPLISGGIQ